jgi:hypothetical protein
LHVCYPHAMQGVIIIIVIEVSILPGVLHHFERSRLAMPGLVCSAARCSKL